MALHICVQETPIKDDNVKKESELDSELPELEDQPDVIQETSNECDSPTYDNEKSPRMNINWNAILCKVPPSCSHK